MISILTALEACSDAIFRPVQILAVSSSISSTTLIVTATPTLRDNAASVVAVEPDRCRLDLPRTTATDSATSTATNTAVHTHNINDHSMWMDEAASPAGDNTD